MSSRHCPSKWKQRSLRRRPFRLSAARDGIGTKAGTDLDGQTRACGRLVYEIHEAKDLFSSLKTSSFSFVLFAESRVPVVLEVGVQDSDQFGKINGLGDAVVAANLNRVLSPADIRAKRRDRNDGNVFGIRMIL